MLYTEETLDLIAEYQRKLRVERARGSFLSFVKTVWPAFMEGRHHKIMAEKLQQVAEGKLKRLIINMPPRHTKSEFASYHFPAYLLGRNPKLKIIQATHTAELAEHFGRKTRNLIASPEYQEIFPGVTLRSDSKAAGRWQTAQGAEYFAVGVGGAMTGRGADVLIIDDPHSEQDLSDGAFESCWEWYTSGPRQRLQPGGAIILVMTRWSKKDLTQHLLDQQVKDDKADRWEVIEFPAILPSGNPLWPEWFSLQELEAIKASNYSKWRGQWLQQPVAEEGNIIQSGWWQTWEKNDPPDCEHIIQSWDTAFEKGKRNDYTVCTTWGVFRIDEQPNVILLDVFRERIDFPSLKERALKLYQYWEPDVVIIEAKASGTPLTQELRQIGVPVVNFIPSRGNDKEVRAHSVAPLVEAGVVWVPDRAWAKELVEECADFPSGSHDDLVDSTTQALLRFRQGGFIRLGSDYEDDELPQRKRKYY